MKEMGLSFMECLTGPYFCVPMSGLNPVLAGEVSYMSDMTHSASLWDSTGLYFTLCDALVGVCG